jgi:hypothetical protein
MMPLQRNVEPPVGIKGVNFRVTTCQAKRHRSHVADSSSSSQLGTTESSRKEHGASFETHRAECARCARYAADFGAAIALLKSALTDSEGHTEFSEDLAQAILAACRETN